MKDHILIHGLEFYAAIGVSDAERRVGQRLRADLTLAVDLRLAGASDDLADTISYAEVAERVVALAGAQADSLLERMATRITEALLAEFPVDEVRLRLTKVPPPMALAVAEAGVEIVRRPAPEDGDE
ncbi:MAG: dihydroneopterin aldolase [Anaerolineales bacterium]|nr:dihydroneopterin aldolase [Anaerolineales bacterium]MCB9127880.1 dihydroneopterin aldolase [Ardenticatenales bacterium]MCB9171642.1 dihydroneopterin aldolase [Ardenticatenales bacterium]